MLKVYYSDTLDKKGYVNQSAAGPFSAPVCNGVQTKTEALSCRRRWY